MLFLRFIIIIALICILGLQRYKTISNYYRNSQKKWKREHFSYNFHTTSYNSAKTTNKYFAWQSGRTERG